MHRKNIANRQSTNGKETDSQEKSQQTQVNVTSSNFKEKNRCTSSSSKFYYGHYLNINLTHFDFEKTGSMGKFYFVGKSEKKSTSETSSRSLFS